MEEINQETAFMLILHAGNAKSSYMEAISFANKGQFDKANDKIAEGEEELNKAHGMQTDLLVKMASGNNVDVDILMVHAQDHLNSAIIMKDLAKQIIFMQEEIMELKRNKK